MSYEFFHGDCLKIMPEMAQMTRADLVFFSPPYEDARTYGIDFSLSGQAWVDWMVKVFEQCQQICTGLVACVCQGRTRDYRWSAVPALLTADLHRAGFNLRNPPIFHRVGIPGSGGPDWLRSDYEWIVCTSRPGKLPWSDNTAIGHPPKWASGGEMSHRLSDGTRKNQWGSSTNGRSSRARDKYDPPVLANPGNVISLIVGGGLMGGDEYCSQNEAPFPEALAEFFVRSFCPEGGKVLDPMCGSGTTVAVAHRWKRHGIGIDIRESQVQLATRRLENETERLFA